MSLRSRIEELNEFKKRLYGATAIDLGITGLGYIGDYKPLIFLGCASVLYDCYRGISTNNSRNELIRQEEIQRRFGGGR